jgi:hypothetical protein
LLNTKAGVSQHTSCVWSVLSGLDMRPLHTISTFTVNTGHAGGKAARTRAELKARTMRTSGHNSSLPLTSKKPVSAGHWWLTSVILVT